MKAKRAGAAADRVEGGRDGSGQRDMQCGQAERVTDQGPTKAEQDEAKCVEFMEDLDSALEQRGLGRLLLLCPAIDETLGDGAVVEPDEDGDGGSHDDGEDDLPKVARWSACARQRPRGS
jgi:hypothetical protein